MIKYKGYVGIFEFDETHHLFRGKVANIEDFVTFQGQSIKEIQEAFEDAVNEYVDFCKKYRKQPEKTRSFSKDKKTSGGG